MHGERIKKKKHNWYIRHYYASLAKKMTIWKRNTEVVSVFPSIIKFSLQAIAMIPEQFNNSIWSHLEVSQF
jgi:hypothetical protein